MEKRVEAELLVQRSIPWSIQVTAEGFLSPLFLWSLRVSQKSLLCSHELFS